MENKSTRDLTNGDPVKVMIGFAIPIFISQLFQQLYSTADTYIVGHFLGTDSLAAVSSSGQIIYLMISFVIGFAMGSGVIISRYFGAGDHVKVEKAINTSLAFGIVSGTIISIIGFIASPWIMVMMNTDPSIIDEATSYFRIFFLGVMFQNVYNFARGVMQSLGDSKRPLYYLAFSSVLNVILDWIFVGSFGWGVWSAALASVISQGISAVLCMIRILSKDFAYNITIKSMKIDGPIFKEIFKQGLPAGIQNSVIGIANSLVQSQINSFEKFATAAFGIFAKVEGFVFLPIQSFNMASTTFISQNFGAKKYDRVKIGAKIGIIAPILFVIVIGIVERTYITSIASIFDSDPQVLAFITKQAYVECLFYPFLAFSHSSASVFRGVGKSFIPMIVMLSCWCVIRVTYIITVMKIFGQIQYIYAAYPFTWTLSSLAFGYMLFCTKWLDNTKKA